MKTKETLLEYGTLVSKARYIESVPAELSPTAALDRPEADLERTIDLGLDLAI